jgi:hypothetical protein
MDEKDMMITQKETIDRDMDAELTPEHIELVNANIGLAIFTINECRKEFGRLPFTLSHCKAIAYSTLCACAVRSEELSGSFQTYCRKSIRNAIISEAAKKDTDTVPLRDRNMPFDDNPDRRRALVVMYMVSKRLPYFDWWLLKVRHGLEGMDVRTITQIADEIECSRATVYDLMREAYDRLSVELRREGVTDWP